MATAGVPGQHVMNNATLLKFLSATWIGLMAAAAAPALVDPGQKALVDPDLIMSHRDEIGLSDTQAEAIHGLFEKAGPYFEEREGQLRQLTTQLAAALEADPLEEAKPLELLDKI